MTRPIAAKDRVSWTDCGYRTLTGTVRCVETEDGTEAAYVVPDPYDFETSRLTHLVDLADLTRIGTKAGAR
jgi:hypothetical protein